MNCPGQETIEHFFEEALAPADMDLVRGHVAECGTCAAHVRKLGEEAESLRRHLPDVPAVEGRPIRIPATVSSPSQGAPASWNLPALAAAVIGILLLGGLVGFNVARLEGEAIQARELSTERVRTSLAQGNSDRAIVLLESFPKDAGGRRAADDSRRDIAAALVKAGDWNRAASVLEPVQVGDREAADAVKFLDLRLTIAARRFETSVLRNGAIPAPFELDGFLAEARSPILPEDMAIITRDFLSVARERREYASSTDPAMARLESLAKAARYALGECPFKDLPALDDAEVRFQVGDLLFRERQFDRAIETWKPILSDARAYRKLSELAALRKLAPPTLKLADYDLESLLGRDKKIDDEAAARAVELFGRRVPIKEPQFGSKGNVKYTPDPTADPDLLVLLEDFSLFTIEPETGRPFTSRNGASLGVTSAYRGAIRFRLFRVSDLKVWSELDADSFMKNRAALTPVKEWEQQFEPLSGTKAETDSWSAVVPHREPGLYAVLADARYCPVVAAARFIITDAGLLQQIASDQVLIYAADRITGAPISGLKLKGTVAGSYEIQPGDLLPKDDADAAEFKRGFDTAWSRKTAEKDTTRGYLSGFQRATDLRADHPDVKLEFSGATGSDGLFRWKVAPAWRTGYVFSVMTEVAEGTPSRVETVYSGAKAGPVVKSLVFTDRPVYRPGDRMSFKGILRLQDAEGLMAYDRPEALVEFTIQERVVEARTMKVTEFGTISGDFILPADVVASAVTVAINNQAPRRICKIEEYRKPEFEIVANTPPTVKSGDEAQVDLRVQTYSGDPIPNADVVVQLSETTVALKTSSGDFAATWFQPEVPTPGRVPRATESRTLKTDRDGRCVYRFSTERGISLNYHVEIRAVDGARRQVGRSMMIESRSSAAMIVIDPDRPCYVAGEMARIRFHAPGMKSLRVEEVTVEADKFAVLLDLDDRGIGILEYRIPEKPRALQVGVRSEESWDWTAVPLRIVPRPAPGTETVSMTLDRSFYRVGETAKVTLHTSLPRQHAILVHATGTLRHAELLVVERGGRTIEIPVTADFSPNISIRVLAIRSDTLHEAAADLIVPPAEQFLTLDVTPDRAEYRPGDDCQATILVTDSAGRPVADCEVALSVVDEAVYAVESDTTPDLREFLHKYRRSGEIQKSFFFSPPVRRFILWKAPTFVKASRTPAEVFERKKMTDDGPMDAMGIAGGSGGGERYGGRMGGRENLAARGGGTAARNQAANRSEFSDTAYWAAHIRTGADGTAVVKFAFPDNLTSFRFTARGLTKEHKVGSVRQNAAVRKDFYVRLATPRTFQEQDEVVVAGLVHNYTAAAQKVRCALKSPYPVTPPASEVLDIPAGGISKVEYTLTVDRHLAAGSFSFEAVAESGVRDGVTLSIPGRRYGVPFQDGRSGSLASGGVQEEVLRLPNHPIPGTVELTMRLDPGIHAALIEGLEPLIEYPYGCLEQTISRFVPAVAVDRALANIPHRWKEKLPSVIATGLRKVYGHQNGDGGWGWWSGSGSSVPTTAYVLYGLAVCRQNGVGVDRRVVDKAAAFLRTQVESHLFKADSACNEKTFLADRLGGAAYAVLALAEHDAAWKAGSVHTRRLVATMADRVETREPIDDICLALACHRVNLKDASDGLAVKVEKAAPTEVRMASLLLQLQVARGGDGADCVRYLLSRRRGSGWATTNEGAYAILGLTSLLQRPAPVEFGPGRVTIMVNGEAAGEVVMPATVDPAFDGKITVKEPAGKPWGGKMIVRLAFDGKGSAFYTLQVKGLTKDEAAAPVRRGLDIEREYLELTSDGWRKIDGAHRAGSQILVHLKATTSEPRSFVRISDPRPTGFEPAAVSLPTEKAFLTRVEALSDRVDLKASWPATLEKFRSRVRGDAKAESAWVLDLVEDVIRNRRFVPTRTLETVGLPAAVAVSAVQHGDSATHFFLAAMPAGTSHFYYQVTAELAGDLFALPAEGELMYEPEVYGSTAESALVVDDGRGGRAIAAGVLPAPPGVDGLLAVLKAVRDSGAALDPDRIIDLVPHQPSVASLVLAAVESAPDSGLRAWLFCDAAIKSATPALKSRIDAALRDSETRILGARALSESDPARHPEWVRILEEALTGNALSSLGQFSVKDRDLSIDGAFLWASADHRFKRSVLAQIQRWRKTRFLEKDAIRAVTVPDIARLIGLNRDADLVAWQLSQRMASDTLKFSELKARLETELGLTLNVVTAPADAAKIEIAAGTVQQVLDRGLAETGLYYVVRGRELWVGTLEDLVK